jgi:hypothetical protein
MRLDMPLLLLCGMGLGAFCAMVALVVVGGMVVMLPFSSQYAVNDVSVTRAEFVRKSWPLLVGFPVVAGCALAIVYALWRELPWSRRAIIAYWVVSLGAVCLMAIVSGKPGDLLTSVVMFGGIIGLLSWYLYRKPSVRAYYSALRALPHNRATPVPDSARREA